MRKILLAAAALTALPLAIGYGQANAAACVGGNNLGIWTTTPGFSCTIGDKTFSNFTYADTSGGGATAIPASEVNVILVNNGASGIGFGFQAPWSVAGSQSLDSLIGFSVSVTPPTGGVFIKDAALVQGGSSQSGLGVGSVAENLSNNVNLLTIDAASQVKLSDSETFTPTGSVSVTKDISVNANGGSASISLAQDTFSQTTAVAEPGTIGLLGIGLFGIGMVMRRRSRK